MASSKSSLKKQKAKLKFHLTLSLLLILIGIVLIAYGASRNFNFSPSSSPVLNSPEVISPQFSRIKSINIPKIKRDLTVEDGSIVNGRWEVSEDGVSYYTDSNLPEEGNNTVLYGHNKERIIGGLVDMRKGDKVELTLESGKVLSYEVVETKTIKPNEVSILNDTEGHQLTIYTCTGFLDSARFVVIAKPIV